MAVRADGILAGEFLPASLAVFYGTPRRAETGLGVVSWAVVAICE